MIQVLDQKTINQIAAGEVVERPSAVVKELMDNSLDAGASAITIEIKEGGISMIRITDNGAGIAKEEIPTAFLRHATSKIRNTEDLLSVTSLGFRGEALSSIAAVAQVELITKRKEDIVGTRYSIEGGKETGCEEVGCPEGTTFVVRNLFYNTPARRKFLKSKTTEGNYIHELVQRYSLAHADIRFSFIVDGKTKFQTSGDGQVKTNIFYHYGREITKELIPICQEQDGMRLEGFIGKPILSRGNRSMMNYFVNGRYIKSPILANATMQGYQGFLMGHRYPFVVLMLSIDSSFIDVNVHPTKMEIRFTNQMEVLSLVRDTVTEALKQSTLIPDVTLDEKEKQYARDSASDLCYDLSDEQKERAGLTDEEIYEMTDKAALAEKYQKVLADKEGENFGAYDYNGKAYEKMLEEHKLKVKKKFWDKVPFGNVTLNHKFEDQEDES